MRAKIGDALVILLFTFIGGAMPALFLWLFAREMGWPVSYLAALYAVLAYSFLVKGFSQALDRLVMAFANAAMSGDDK